MTKTKNAKVTYESALKIMRETNERSADASNHGRCNCGDYGSWDTPICGTSGPAQKACVWAACDTHHTATGYPVPADVYDIVAKEADELSVSIDTLIDG